MSVGYVYDPVCLKHETGSFPENAQRLEAIMDRLRQAGLLERMIPIAGEEAALTDLTRIHAPDLIERVQYLSQLEGGYDDPDIIVSAGTYEAALHAAGGTIAATRAVLDGQVSSAWAFVRPPGHHATRREMMGFCFFNNIAIAAAWAMATRGVERIAIVDFDVHHGNGTAEAFRDDERVLYVSLHQYPYYPGTGHWREKGGGAGHGTMLNIPLPAGSGDKAYDLAFTQLVVPMVRRFRPQLILVSAGYDAHWADPLAWMSLSLAGYRRMAEALIGLADELCGGRLVFVLYTLSQLDVLGHGVATCVCAMLGLPYADPYGPARDQERPVDRLIGEIARWHGL